MKSDIIRSRLALAPKSPGVYLFRGQSGEVIYVGKASDLRNRVRSYFGGKSGLSTKVLRLVEVAADIEYILAGSEQEALVLEADLIKRYRPQYNARLKDDKSFPFLEVDTDSEWPTVSVTRRRQDDGSVYFGPFASARSMRQTLRLIRKTFRLRVCTGPMPMNRERACLNMHIGLCPGPCVGAISREEYRRTVDGVILFLQGRHRDVLNSLMQEMKQAAARLDFEQAALLRDKMKAVELVTSRYGGVTALRGDQDILAVAQDEEDALVDIFSVRDGRALGRQTFPVEGSAGLLPSEVLRAFVLAYYSTATNVPPVLMLQHPVADARLIAGWLSERRGGPVRMVVPRRGVRKQLLDNAADGVARQLAGLRALGAQGAPPREAGLRELKDVLGLPTLPHGFEVIQLGEHLVDYLGGVSVEDAKALHQSLDEVVGFDIATLVRPKYGAQLLDVDRPAHYLLHLLDTLRAHSDFGAGQFGKIERPVKNDQGLRSILSGNVGVRQNRQVLSLVEASGKKNLARALHQVPERMGSALRRELDARVTRHQVSRRKPRGNEVSLRVLADCGTVKSCHTHSLPVRRSIVADSLSAESGQPREQPPCWTCDHRQR